MIEITCGNCRKTITNKTEIEYSEDYGEFYCDYKCAINDFFDRARCTPFDYKDKEELNRREIAIKDGKLYWK